MFDVWTDNIGFRGGVLFVFASVRLSGFPSMRNLCMGIYPHFSNADILSTVYCTVIWFSLFTTVVDLYTVHTYRK